MKNKRIASFVAFPYIYNYVCALRDLPAALENISVKFFPTPKILSMCHNKITKSPLS